MKPALSPATTGTLSSFSAKAFTSSTTPGSVTTVRMISRNFCTGAGLKKCTPITRPGLAVAVEISVTESEEVLVASTASSATMPSSVRKTSCLTSSFSTIASMTSWQSFTSEMFVVKVIRPRSASWSSPLSLPRSTARPVECSR